MSYVIQQRGRNKGKFLSSQHNVGGWCHGTSNKQGKDLSREVERIDAINNSSDSPLERLTIRQKINKLKVKKDKLNDQNKPVDRIQSKIAYLESLVK